MTVLAQRDTLPSFHRRREKNPNTLFACNYVVFGLARLSPHVCLQGAGLAAQQVLQRFKACHPTSAFRLSCLSPNISLLGSKVCHQPLDMCRIECKVCHPAPAVRVYKVATDTCLSTTRPLKVQGSPPSISFCYIFLLGFKACHPTSPVTVSFFPMQNLLLRPRASHAAHHHAFQISIPHILPLGIRSALHPVLHTNTSCAGSMPPCIQGSLAAP